MRSSIACSRCRRSKVKCVNNGVGTQCRACETSGRECEYPSAVVGSSRRRDSLSGRPEGAGDAERRQRPRKTTHTWVPHVPAGARESPRPLLDALDPKILTPNVWLDLFEIYEKHYSADFPFLHVTTFKKPLNIAKLQPQYQAGDSPVSAKPPGSNEFLLAFLALTARFHPKLVAHHSPPAQGRPSNPLLASEYYAEAVNDRLIPYALGHRRENLETVQTYLMLSMHEWGMSRGSHAWRLVGQAIRAARVLGLQYDADLDDEPLARNIPLDGDSERADDEIDRKRGGGLSSSEDSDLFLQQEIRRRTFWSCFIMDRYLSSGKFRPQSLHPREFRVQLPASERKFSFVDRVRTLMLGEDDNDAEVYRQTKMKIESKSSPPRSLAKMQGRESRGELEYGEAEGVVSRYVRILELYGKVLNWSLSGGRRKEEYPPWDERSKFFQLRKQLQDYKTSLPRSLALNRNNLQAHIDCRSSPAYTLLHIVYLLCQVFLHREYIPFLPLQSSKPAGPLDEPTFPADKYTIPDHFWEDSASECFAAARDIIDLLSTCQEYHHLVETPVVGFAVYIVAFIGVYCITFPEMDPQGYMCTPISQRTKTPDSLEGRSPGFTAATNAAEMLHSLGQRLHMAAGWYKAIRRIGKFLKRVKDTRARSARGTNGSARENDSSDAQPAQNGGMDEYKMFERGLTELGNFDSEDVEMTDAHQHGDRNDDESSHDTADGRSDDEFRSGGPSTAAEPARAESGGGSWSAINTPHSNPASRHPSISTPSNNGGFRSYESYPQPHQQQNASQTPQHQQQQSYGFRPAYSADAPSAGGPPPSLLSPAVTTPSQASPPYDRHGSYGSGSGSWAPQNSTYGSMAPPHQPSQQQQQGYNNGTTPHLTPINSPQNGSHTSQHPQPHANQASRSAATVTGNGRGWPTLSQQETETWLAALPQYLCADDLAAFTDGSDPSVYVTTANTYAASHGHGGYSSGAVGAGANARTHNFGLSSWLGAVFTPPHDILGAVAGAP